MDALQNCVIIGSGPAGYTAAIYAARADLKPQIYTGLEPGGQLTTTTEVENFPGFKDGITGPELMIEMQKQAERFETKIHYEMVSKVKFSTEIGGIHQLFIGEKQVNTKTVIIATGASAKYLGLEAEKKYSGGGVSACATCDGFFYKAKDVIVVGAGDTACEEAVYLSKICNKVTLLVRRNEFRASKVMVQRVMNNRSIDVKFNTELIDIEGANFAVERGIIINNQTQEKSKLDVHGIFIAIGHQPNTLLFAEQLDLDENGYIVTAPKSTKTNLPGVFAAGDVQDHHYRQAITSAGSGCMAAMDAEKYLSDLV